MDIATLVGLIGTFTLILIAIGSNLPGFIDPASVVIVIGGATLTVMTSMPLGRVLGLHKVVMKSVFTQSNDLKGLASKLVEFATVARRDGILALENHIDDDTDPFISTGVRMAVDGTDPQLIEKLLFAEIESLADRHKNGKAICDLMGKYAPAFGMIGTLIGLVIMLSNMSDPSAIGPGMAVALLTTLYGAVMANAIFLPIADKLAYYSKEELKARMLILQGVMAIQSGDNPRIVEQKLNVFLAPSERGGHEEA
ncbi:Chemotaxis protein PomA [Planctomycetes bacterium Pan216]|uniref:Chemotaxis protein PomA n=1 Tax=Kolteria novifilia TaxID=2527975 RepID=A0A518AWW0_9BACT|nr:Chemotaxis protein PomA [Planctomycetes bacterium Pan216]